MIGEGHEADRLYCLNSFGSTVVCSVSNSPNLIHRRLGDSSLFRLQKMIPSSSKLSKFDCLVSIGEQTTYPCDLSNCVVSFSFSSF